MTSTNKTRWWQVGSLLPVLMVILFAVDVAGRLVPLTLVSFRTFEPALRTTPRTLGEFATRKTVRVRGAYGDLAALGNVRRLRQYHDELFESDALGFRNSGDIYKAHYAGIVAGDSFTVGSALPDADTLPAQLSALARERFYNAGYDGVLIPGAVAFLQGELKMTSGVVVLEVVERSLRTVPPPMEDFPPEVFTSAKAAEQAQGATAFLPWLTDVTRKFSPRAPSPLQIVVQRFVKRLQNGKLLYNPYWELTRHETLLNGEDMLFLSNDLDRVGDVASLSSSWGKYFAWYEQQLKPHNLKLVVLLVPNKYTVYGPLAKNPPPVAGKKTPPPIEGDRLLNAIDQKVKAEGIPVVNVTPDFRVQAAKLLPQHQYLYWRDDTHWSAAGVAIAADAVWKTIQTLPPSVASQKNAK